MHDLRATLPEHFQMDSKSGSLPFSRKLVLNWFHVPAKLEGIVGYLCADNIS